MYRKTYKQSGRANEHKDQSDLRTTSIKSFVDVDPHKDKSISDRNIITKQHTLDKSKCGDIGKDDATIIGHACCGILDAVKLGHEECTRKLLKQGADANVFYADGLSPLMAATRSGQVELIQLLLQANANVSAVNSKHETALHYIAGTGRSDCIDVLLAAKADIDAEDQEGSTPLILATKLNDTTSVAALVKSNANVNVKDHLKRTPLHWAAFHNAVECTKIVLATAGMEIDAVDVHGDSAYVLAIKQNAVQILELLLSAGCDRNSIDGLMGTALALAALKGHPDVIELLIANYEDPDEYGYFGMTPLMLATYESHVDAVAALLRGGAEVNASGRMGGTALHKSLMRLSASNEAKRHRIVALLLRANADVNMRLISAGYFTACTNGKNCPLSFAVTSGYISLVRMLLIAGAGCQVTRDEIREWIVLNDIQKFYDFKQLLGPVYEWKSEVRTLMHCCRATIRKNLPGKKIQRAIEVLPIASSLKRYLDFGEFDDIEVERAQMMNEMASGVMESLQISPCGMRALEGTLLHNSITEVYENSV